MSLAWAVLLGVVGIIIYPRWRERRQRDGAPRSASCATPRCPPDLVNLGASFFITGRR
jgi:hypothetical protein